MSPENPISAPSQAALLYALIAQQPFFKGLPARHLQLLTESAMEMEFAAGQSILQEGKNWIWATGRLPNPMLRLALCTDDRAAGTALTSQDYHKNMIAHGNCVPI